MMPATRLRGRAQTIRAETEYFALKTREALQESRERIAQADAAMARLLAGLQAPKPQKPTK
jgi:hypothetical protein